ncbi:MAG: CPBP family intramembrane metalloprotease [Spirochaetales bacterium]|nr:CPBP family intramembrane metalloprotease [Spirochaetales bacterium]
MQRAGRNNSSIEQRPELLSLLVKCAIIGLFWFFLQWGWKSLGSLLPWFLDDLIYLALALWIWLILLLLSRQNRSDFSLDAFLPGTARGMLFAAISGSLAGSGLAGLLFLLIHMDLIQGAARPLSAFELYSALLLRPALEEFVYRFLFLGWLLKQNVPPAAGITLTATLFALGHSLHQVWFALLGLSLGILYWRAGFMSPFVAHWTYNALLLLYARLHP